MSKSQPIIRRRENSWQVDCGTTAGKRRQYSFKTKAEAIAFAARKRTEIIKYGLAAFELSAQQRQDAVRALENLPSGWTLEDAAKFVSKHSTPKDKQISVDDLLEEFVESKESAGRRPRTIKNLRTRVGRFARKFGKTLVHKITTHDIENWLRSMKYTGGINRHNYLLALGGFWNFAINRGYAQQNPVRGIEKVSVDEKIPEILTVDEFTQLIRVAESQVREMIPYFAIATFAGLRPAEIEGLDWKNIDLGKKLIRVVPETAKKRRMRYVEMSDNLVEWLLPYRRDSGYIFYARKLWERVRRLAKVTWAPDILRHTYASMHIALHEDAAKTALQMGHRDTAVLFNHYRDLVTKPDAQKFWTMGPLREEKVLSIPRSG